MKTLMECGARVRIVQTLPRRIISIERALKVGDEGAITHAAESPYGDGRYTVLFDNGNFCQLAGRELELIL